MALSFGRHYSGVMKLEMMNIKPELLKRTPWGILMIAAWMSYFV